MANASHAPSPSAVLDAPSFAAPEKQVESRAPTFPVVNPASNAAVRSYDGHTPSETDAIVALVHQAQRAWRRTPFAERARLMHEAAAVLRRRSPELCTLMATEMGKTLHEGRDEIEKCAFACDYFADNAEAFLAPEPIGMGPGVRAYTTTNPLGVVLAIMPWNFPFWQVVRFAAPNLMAGNAGILKHAQNVPGCALALESVFREAGFPQDLFRVLLIDAKAADGLIAHPMVAAVTLTGSVPAGRAVASAAGQALKKCVLELGGSDAYVVLADADTQLAARVCATARMVNAGQSCIAGKRFVVSAAAKGAFEPAFVEAMEAYAMGDPRDDATKLGPLESVKARDQLHAQVTASIAKGARLLTGGVIPARPGAWYPPTVLTDVKPGTPAYDEELFGPVAAVIEARDDADAVRIANDSCFGLGSAVISRDVARAERIAAVDLDAGMAFVNTNVRSDPRLPFGGVKDSGYGREVSRFGIFEFVNIKSVLVQGYRI